MVQFNYKDITMISKTHRFRVFLLISKEKLTRLNSAKKNLATEFILPNETFKKV